MIEFVLTIESIDIMIKNECEEFIRDTKNKLEEITNRLENHAIEELKIKYSDKIVSYSLLN